jgi:hypothetical protein
MGPSVDASDGATFPTVSMILFSKNPRFIEFPWPPPERCHASSSASPNFFLNSSASPTAPPICFQSTVLTKQISKELVVKIYEALQ